MHIKDILRNLKPLKYDTKILMTSIGEKVTNPANTAGFITSIHTERSTTFQLQIDENKDRIFFPSSFTDALNSDPRLGHLARVSFYWM